MLTLSSLFLLLSRLFGERSRRRSSSVLVRGRAWLLGVSLSLLPLVVVTWPLLLLLLRIISDTLEPFRLLGELWDCKRASRSLTNFLPFEAPLRKLDLRGAAAPGPLIVVVVPGRKARSKLVVPRSGTTALSACSEKPTSGSTGLIVLLARDAGVSRFEGRSPYCIVARGTLCRRKLGACCVTCWAFSWFSHSSYCSTEAHRQSLFHVQPFPPRRPSLLSLQRKNSPESAPFSSSAPSNAASSPHRCPYLFPSFYRETAGSLYVTAFGTARSSKRRSGVRARVHINPNVSSDCHPVQRILRPSQCIRNKSCRPRSAEIANIPPQKPTISNHSRLKRSTNSPMLTHKVAALVGPPRTTQSHPMFKTTQKQRYDRQTQPPTSKNRGTLSNPGQRLDHKLYQAKTQAPHQQVTFSQRQPVMHAGDQRRGLAASVNRWSSAGCRRIFSSERFLGHLFWPIRIGGRYEMKHSNGSTLVAHPCNRCA